MKNLLFIIGLSLLVIACQDKQHQKETLDSSADTLALSGTQTEYHPNKMVKSVCGMVEGKRQGTYIELDERGQLLVKAEYDKDELHGDYFKYKYTRVVEERHYNQGKLEGMLKKYYDNGKLLEESPYTDDKINGIAKWYNQEGKLTMQYEYKNGVLVK